MPERRSRESNLGENIIVAARYAPTEQAIMNIPWKSAWTPVSLVTYSALLTIHPIATLTFSTGCEVTAQTNIRSGVFADVLMIGA